MSKKYEFKFFFEFGAGGCLWPSNKKAIDEFTSPADAKILNLKGQLIYNPLEKLSLSKETLLTIEELDQKYYSYLNQEDPTETVIFEKENFLKSAKSLFKQIKKELGDEFEIIWNFDI